MSILGRLKINNDLVMNNTRTALIALAILFVGSYAQANTLEDVIYKKDGSILRGTLIEQDFENKRYKIQLSGGSVFVVQEDEVTKISKEPSIQSLHPTASPKETITQYTPAYSNGLGPLNTKNTFFIGAFSHRRSQPYFDTGYTYNEAFRGTQFGFEHVVNENFAMVYTLEKAELREIVIEDESTDTDLYTSLPDEKASFLGKKVNANYSTNLYKNWRFYAGLGAYHNDYKKKSGDDALYGARFSLGMGYSWTRMQIMLRAGGDITNNEKDIEYSLFDFSLALGINF